MKFHLSLGEGHRITGIGAAWVRVGVEEQRASFLLAPDAIVSPWARGGFESLGDAEFAAVLALGPEIVLLAREDGSAFRTRASIACSARRGRLRGDGYRGGRATYNIIAAEGRTSGCRLLLP